MSSAPRQPASPGDPTAGIPQVQTVTVPAPAMPGPDAPPGAGAAGGPLVALEGLSDSQLQAMINLLQQQM